MFSVHNSFLMGSALASVYKDNSYEPKSLKQSGTVFDLGSNFNPTGKRIVNQSYATSPHAIEHLVERDISRSASPRVAKGSITFSHIKQVNSFAPLKAGAELNAYYAPSLNRSSLNTSLAKLSHATERLATGSRINSAADDAAGLQIAVRMQANIIGMKAALHNTSDGIVMLQTADSALFELTSIALRQNELVIKSLNGLNSVADRVALDNEYQALSKEAERILMETNYAGNNLFDALEATAFKSTVSKGAKLTGVTFQIGSSVAETLTVGFNRIDLSDLLGGVAKAGGLITPPSNIETVAAAKQALDFNSAFTTEIGVARAKLGANLNRLTYSASNLKNVIQYTSDAVGQIMDADFAAESSVMTKNQMQLQLQTNILFRFRQSAELVVALLK